MKLSHPVRKAFLQPAPFALEVQATSAPGNLRTALEAFRHSIYDIGSVNVDRGWPGPAWLSEVIDTPSSCLLMLDLGEPPATIAEEILLALPRVLEAHGVQDATVALARQGGPLSGLALVPNAVVLRAYPNGDQGEEGWPFDASWIDEAFEWLHEVDPIPCAIVSVEFSLSRDSARRFVDQQLMRKGTDEFKMISGNTQDQVRVASLFANVGRMAPAKQWANLLLGAGGPKCEPRDRVAEFRALVAIGRHLASHAEYIFIDFIEPLREAVRSMHVAPWRNEGPVPTELIDRVRDVLVLDGFPWQMLGPGHLERLGGPPPGSVPLDDGRVELAVGDSRDWLDEKKAKTNRQRARQLLSACLPPFDEAMKIAFPPPS